jgi:parvulin-like peptidyl-prolyl isomerase
MSVRAVTAALAVGFAIVADLVLGCRGQTAPHDATPSAAVHTRLATGIAAVVGTEEIPVALVAEVARAQRTEPRVALEHLVSDALAAQEARADGEDRAPTTAWSLESTIARATAEHIKAASVAAGPPTDAEVAQATARHWRDVDLPEQIKVIHALVPRPKDATQSDAARALASQLAVAVADATSDDDFEARAKAVPHGALRITVERLPSFVADGRVAEGEPSQFDPAFARGAFALKKPGETSAPVESSFGWHVVRLVERRPPHVLPLEERRTRFTREIYLFRSHDELTRILAARTASTRVEIEPGIDSWMEAASASSRP